MISFLQFMCHSLCFLGLAIVYLVAAIAALWAFRREGKRMTAGSEPGPLCVGLLDLRGVAELGRSCSVAWDP